MTREGARTVVGVGEALLRLAAPGHERLEQAGTLDVEVGGAELNALIAAAALGADAAWLSRLADNPLGRRIAAHARGHGVRAVIDWDREARAPLYFVEHGAALRPSEVLYDRDATAMRALEPGLAAWRDEAKAAAALLTTGITCGLGPGPAAAARELLATARAAGARTVFDVNHRGRLWSWEEALPVLRETVAHVDVLAASHHDLVALLDGSEAEADEALALRALEAFGCEMVLMRRSETTPGRTVRVSASVVTATAQHASDTYEAGVVDAFGAGDAALGAFVAALLDGKEPAVAVERAAWACAFHHTVPGDAPRIRPADLAQRPDAVRAILR